MATPIIVKMFGANIGQPWLLVFLSDGSAYAFNVVTATSQSIAATGTFDNAGPGDIAIWQGQIVLIVDPTKGYFRWPGAGQQAGGGGSAGAGPKVELIHAPDVTQGAAGNVEIGQHHWAITFTINGVETNLGEEVSLDLSAASQVRLKNIQKGPTGTTARNIYRTTADESGPFALVGTIANNTATAFTDNVADASLTTPAPTEGIVDSGTHQWAVSFFDGTTDSNLTDPSGNLNVDRPATVLVYQIPLGPVGTTERKIWRTTIADPGTFSLVDTIADDTTTEYSDIKSDAQITNSQGLDTNTLVSLIDAARVGTTLAVFAGRVWIANNRTVQFTAPNNFSDFSISDAAGSFVMTDSNFVGPIQKLLTALDVLWIFGEAAINQLSNVSVIANTTTTTFSNINVSSSVGTIFPQSVISFLRQIEFATKYGIVQQIGVTPQRISEKIDGTYSNLDLTQPVTAGLVVLNEILCYGLMVTYNDPDNNDLPRKIILLVTFDGKWFIGSQGDDLVRMASVEDNGSYRLFGADTNSIRELFVQPHYPIHKLKMPFFDNGDVTAGKELVRVMMVMHFHDDPVLINSTITPQAALGPKQALDPTKTNEVEFFGVQGTDIELIGSSGNEIQFIGKNYALQQWGVGLISQLVSFDMSWDSDPFHICGYAIDVIDRQSWGDVS